MGDGKVQVAGLGWARLVLVLVLVLVLWDWEYLKGSEEFITTNDFYIDGRGTIGTWDLVVGFSVWYSGFNHRVNELKYMIQRSFKLPSQPPRGLVLL
jgi:hypothetical protein